MINVVAESKRKERRGEERRSPPVSARLSAFNVISLDSAWVWRMSELTRDGTAEPVSRDSILRRDRGQGRNQAYLKQGL